MVRLLATNTLDHLEITKKIDTELAAKLSGSRFAVLEGDLAKLQELINNFYARLRHSKWI